MRPILGLAVLAGLLTLSACATTVNRVDPKAVTDESGYWNDTDSRLVAEEMITDCLRRPWVGVFSAAHGGKQPVVIVGTIRNRSQEHIPTTTFTKDLEREFINSGLVNFVASKDERSEVRDERDDQQMNSGADTMKRQRQENASDFMLIGNIDQINDTKDGTSAKFYQVNLELVNMETNQKAWIGTKDIKKMVKRGAFGL
jgi:uncharacterized protein (TIGR02722 family)